MMNLLNKLIKTLLDWILTFVTVAVVIILFVGVVLRYIFNAPLYWSEEVSVIGLVVMVFLGGAILVRQGKNVTITIVHDLCGPKTARWMRITSEFLSLLIVTVMTWLSWKLIWRMAVSTTATLRISEGWFGVIAFVGFVLMLYYQIQNMVTLLGKRRSHSEKRLS